MMQFSIPVAPTAKGRPRVVRNKQGQSRTYTPDKTVDAEERIRWHLRERIGSTPPLDGPITLSATFYVPRPKSAPKRVTEPITRPDLDQYIKLLLDACNGIVFKDDSQVVELDAAKRFGDPRIEMTVTVAA